MTVDLDSPEINSSISRTRDSLLEILTHPIHYDFLAPQKTLQLRVRLAIALRRVIDLYPDRKNKNGPKEQFQRTWAKNFLDAVLKGNGMLAPYFKDLITHITQDFSEHPIRVKEILEVMQEVYDEQGAALASATNFIANDPSSRNLPVSFESKAAIHRLEFRKALLPQTVKFLR